MQGFTLSLYDKSSGHKKPKDVDPRLIVPLCDVIFPFCYLPEKIRKPLRFGIEHEGVRIAHNGLRIFIGLLL